MRDLLAGLALLFQRPSRRGRARFAGGATPLAAQADDVLGVADIRSAGLVVGIDYSDRECERLLAGVTETRDSIRALRGLRLAHDVEPAIRFDQCKGVTPLGTRSEPPRWSTLESPSVPSEIEELAFWPIRRLAELIRTRRLSSVELTRMYLRRLERFDPVLHCVVTLMEDSAMQEAINADRELAAGAYRGLLHGIPYGIKDLFATRVGPTTWGAPLHARRTFDFDSTVVEHLRAAGAVLIAKLSLGPLARGDRWSRGLTRNPWNTETGSGGSSAGSAAAAAAGLVGFSIGSSTLDSIIGPASRCGVTGLRPTFGRISRHGAMTLAWSLDKIGPICRSAEDCAVVMHELINQNSRDPSVVAPFSWNAESGHVDVRLGYVGSAFGPLDVNSSRSVNDHAALDVLRSLYPRMIEVDLPDLPDAALLILHAEAAAAFDELLHRYDSEELEPMIGDSWPVPLRQALLIPAVDYIRANRVRTLLCQRMSELMDTVDVYAIPTIGTRNSFVTNLTGHPCVTVPTGMSDGLPTGISFVGRHLEEAVVLAVAHAFQSSTRHHLRHPPGFLG